MESTSSPKRLDISLAGAYGISRSQAQKYLAKGLVRVNGAPQTSAHLLVSEHDTIDLSRELETSEENLLPPAPKPEILFENEDVLVFSKPAGLLVHPTPTNPKAPSLINAILEHSPKTANVGGDPLRPGIVHRLDKEASGVMIVAKHEHAHAWLKEQFKERLTEKHYTVLVLGSVAEETGTITFPIARSTTRGRMAARPHSQEGKEAITHYDVISRFSSSTLLDVRIETGRTHQIRAHFFALGHPVAGDVLYTHKKLKQLPIARLFLHAHTLTITLPSGERRTFTSEIPRELQDLLTSLKPAPRV